MRLDPHDFFLYEDDLKSVINIAKQAGEAILAIRDQKSVIIKTKADDSFVTNADLLSHVMITAALSKLTEDLPILSEEGKPVSYAKRQSWPLYWLVDPLDGTYEFIHGSDQFAVNIALIKDHQPILGVMYLPSLQTCYYAAVGHGAFKEKDGNKNKLQTRKIVADEQINVVLSPLIKLGKLQKLLDRLSEANIFYLSSSIKFCWLAEGSADLYLRAGGNYEWDTAAGQCILEQAGGSVVDLHWQPLLYNQHQTLAIPPFIAMGDLIFPWQKIMGN